MIVEAYESIILAIIDGFKWKIDLGAKISEISHLIPNISAS